MGTFEQDNEKEKEVVDSLKSLRAQGQENCDNSYRLYMKIAESVLPVKTSVSVLPVTSSAEKKRLKDGLSAPHTVQVTPMQISDGSYEGQSGNSWTKG